MRVRGKDSERGGCIGFQFSSGKNRCKDRADTDGTEMTSKERLPPSFDVWYEGFQRQYNRYAAEEDDKDGDDHKLPGCKANRRIVVLLPGNDRAKVDKVCQIEKQINDVGDMRFFRLLREPSIITETHTGSEADKQIISP